MGIASRIATILRKDCCERLVKYTAQEVILSGASVGITDFKISVGNFSNNVKKINNVTETMKALDNNQYLLCRLVHDPLVSEELKDECQRIRIMCIMGFTQLQALTSLQEPNKPLHPEIALWITNMSGLLLECMVTVKPTPKMTFKNAKGEEIIGWINSPKSRKKPAKKSATIKSPKLSTGREKSKIAQIMAYQGIDEKDMADALKILKKDK